MVLIDSLCSPSDDEVGRQDGDGSGWGDRDGDSGTSQRRDICGSRGSRSYGVSRSNLSGGTCRFRHRRGEGSRTMARGNRGDLELSLEMISWPWDLTSTRGDSPGYLGQLTGVLWALQSLVMSPTVAEDATAVASSGRSSEEEMDGGRISLRMDLDVGNERRFVGGPAGLPTLFGELEMMTGQLGSHRSSKGERTQALLVVGGRG